MGLQIEYYTTSTGKELSVMTKDKKKRFYLEAYRNGEVKGELTVELYEESVYSDHIEVPNSVNNTLIEWAKTFVKLGFDTVKSYLSDEDTRYTREQVSYVFPAVQTVTKAQLEQMKKRSKKEIERLKKEKSRYYEPIEYSYETNFKILKRFNNGKLLVFYIKHYSEVCKEYCPEVPKAIVLGLYGETKFKNKEEARKFALKVIKTIFRPTNEELKKILEAIDYVLDTNKKRVVNIELFKDEFILTGIEINVKEPEGIGDKVFVFTISPAKLIGTSKQMVFVTGLYVKIKMKKRAKMELRKTLATIKKYLKVSPTPGTKISVYPNVVMPYTDFISFVSEITGVPKAEIKRHLDPKIKETKK